MPDEERFFSMSDICSALAGISKSTMMRRMKELNLIERGYVVRLGRRLLFSSRLIIDLPTLIDSKASYKGKN